MIFANSKRFSARNTMKSANRILRENHYRQHNQKGGKNQ